MDRVSSSRRVERLAHPLKGMAGRASRAIAGVVVAGMAAASVVPAQQPVTKPMALVFDQVTVVDVEQGKLVPDQRVVIVGGLIQAIGGTLAVPLPPGAQVVEAKGKYLIPGLWDMRTQIVGDQSGSDRQLALELVPPLFLINGVTGVRNAWERNQSVSNDYLQSDVEPVAAPSRRILADLLSSDSSTAAGTKEALDAGYLPQKHTGASSVSLDVVSFAILDVARSTHLPSSGPLLDYGKLYGLPAFNVSAAEASDSGLNIIEHVYTSGGLDTLCWAPAGTTARCQPIADRFRRNGTWFMPTIIGSFAERRPPEIVAPHARAIYDRLQQHLSALRHGASLHGNWLRDSTHAITDTAIRAMTVIQQVADFPLAAGTAGKNNEVNVRENSRPLTPGFALHAELAMFAAEGLSPLRVLQSATINPVKIMHATDSLGTVAPGKLADLVLLDANPLEDITNTTAIRAVVADGQYYDRAALDQIWATVKQRAEATNPKIIFP